VGRRGGARPVARGTPVQRCLRTLAWAVAAVLAGSAAADPEPPAESGSPAQPAPSSTATAPGGPTPVDGTPAADGAAAARPRAPRKPFGPLTDDDGKGRVVVVADIHGTIELGIAPFVRRVLEENQGAAAIVFDVDTFGGRVDAAVTIRDALLSAKVPTVAFIDRRAISAGALISYAADFIVFNEGGTMGAATPIQLAQDGEAQPVAEKMVSYMRSEMASTAESKGRRGDIARAMVDAEEEVEGISPKGKLLTLTTDDAVRFGVADAVATSQEQLLELLGLSLAERRTVETNWAEKIVRFLTDPTVSGLLMSVGFLALMIELYTPGVGIPGAAAVVLLGLFFGGHYMVELAGMEEMLLFLLGVVALGIELFVIPGFGIMGMIGVGLIVTSLAMALVGTPLSVSWETGMLVGALGRVMLSITLAVIAMVVLAKRLGESRLGSWLVLRTELARGAQPSDEDYRSQPAEWASYMGKTGRAITDLRLSGKVRIGGELVDAVSQFEYIPAGTVVTVVEVEGARVVVARDPGAVGSHGSEWSDGSEGSGPGTPPAPARSA
jgi:membrane-bound serine protease (ClpP class)